MPSSNQRMAKNEFLKAALFSQRAPQETFPLPPPITIRSSGVVPQCENHGSLMVHCGLNRALSSCGGTEGAKHSLGNLGRTRGELLECSSGVLQHLLPVPGVTQRSHQGKNRTSCFPSAFPSAPAAFWATLFQIFLLFQQPLHFFFQMWW